MYLFFKARIQTSEILTKHFTSITKDWGWGSLGKISDTYKLEKHYYINLGNLFLNVQNYARQ